MTIAIRTIGFFLILCCTALIYSAIHDRSVQLTHFDFLNSHQMLTINSSPELQDWHFYAYPYSHYRYGFSKNQVHEGNKSVFIINKLPIDDGVGSIRQTINAAAYNGKKIEFSGYFKTQNLTGKVLFDLDIFNENDDVIRRAEVSFNTNEFNKDWQRFSIIALIPENASVLSYSARLLGSGQVWFDDFNFSNAPAEAKDISKVYKIQSPIKEAESPERTKYLNIVGYNTEPFGELPLGEQPSDIELWWMSDELKGEYALRQDGNALLLESLADEPEFGVVLKRFRFKDNHVKAIKFSAQMKHQFVKSMASIWLRIEDKDRNNLAFDNLRYTSSGGSSDWQNIEVILPYSENAEIVSFGALLIRNGKLWLRNAKVEPLYEPVSLSSQMLQKPSNLSFE